MQIAHITKKSHFFHNVSYQFEKAFEGHGFSTKSNRRIPRSKIFSPKL